MAKKRVVLTGAAGYVAQRMYQTLRERWDLVPLDVSTQTRDGKRGQEIKNPPQKGRAALNNSLT